MSAPFLPWDWYYGGAPPNPTPPWRFPEPEPDANAVPFMMPPVKPIQAPTSERGKKKRAGKTAGMYASMGSKDAG